MKAIIINEKDCDALLDKLELAKLRDAGHMRGDKPVTLDDMHRTFHFVVTRWLQEQGYGSRQY